MASVYDMVPLTYPKHTISSRRSVTVRLAKTCDIEQLEVLSQGIDGKDHLMADVKQYLDARRDPTGQVNVAV